MELAELKALKETYYTVKKEAETQRKECEKMQEEINKQLDIIIPKITEQLMEFCEIAEGLTLDNSFNAVYNDNYVVTFYKKGVDVISRGFSNERIFAKNAFTVSNRNKIIPFITNWKNIEETIMDSIERNYKYHIKRISNNSQETIYNTNANYEKILNVAKNLDL